MNSEFENFQLEKTVTNKDETVDSKIFGRM